MVITSLLIIKSPGFTVLNGFNTYGLSASPAPLANFGFAVVFSGSASSIATIILSRSSNKGTRISNNKRKHSGKHHHVMPSLSPSSPELSLIQNSPSVLVGFESASSGSEPQFNSSWSYHPSSSSSSSAVKLPV